MKTNKHANIWRCIGMVLAFVSTVAASQGNAPIIRSSVAYLKGQDRPTLDRTWNIGFGHLVTVGVCFLEGGKSLAFASRGGVWVFTRGHIICKRLVSSALPRGSRPISLAASKSGKMLAASFQWKSKIGNMENGIVLWGINTPSIPPRLIRVSTPWSRISQLAFSPSGKFIAGGFLNPGSLRVGIWNVDNGKIVKYLTTAPANGYEHPLGGLVFLKSHRVIAALGSYLVGWDAQSGKILFSHLDRHGNRNLPSLMSCLVAAPDGKTIYAGSLGDILVLSGKNGRMIRVIHLPISQLWSGGDFPRNLSVTISRQQAWNSILGLAISKSGRSLVVGCYGSPKTGTITAGQIFALNVRSGRILYKSTPFLDPVRNMAMLPSGNYLLTGGPLGTLLWRLPRTP